MTDTPLKREEAMTNPERSEHALPDSILSRQFDKVRAKWPTAMLTAHEGPHGYAVLSVSGAPLANADRLNRPTTTIAVIIPHGYPMAAPDYFAFDADLRLAHGGSVMWTEGSHLPGFVRFVFHLRGWDPNRDDLVTIVNTMRQMIGGAAVAEERYYGEQA